MPSPALVFSVLLASDLRLGNIQMYHRYAMRRAGAGDLATHISGVEEDLAKGVALLSSLEEKLEWCEMDDDIVGISFWGERVEEKRKAVRELESELARCQDQFDQLNKELDGPMPATYDGTGQGLSVRAFVVLHEQNDYVRTKQTINELAAWHVANEDRDGDRFPPLESVFGPDHRHRSDCASAGSYSSGPHPDRHYHQSPDFHSYYRSHNHRHDSFRGLFDRARDVVNNPAVAASLVPTNEIKNMLDGFLANLTNQLAGTFEGTARVVDHDTAERSVPGAFVDAPAQPTQPKEAKVKRGRGGFRHLHISCDGCLTGIRGMRYKCEVSSQMIPIWLLTVLGLP
jgi:next-to-BRCA1 protein 1